MDDLEDGDGIGFDQAVEEVRRRGFKRYERVSQLRVALDAAWDTPKRWRLIREYYAMALPDIESGVLRNPYEIGLGEHMTPIEQALWCEIRYVGLPFFLQFPVGRRFVDFGDPIFRIAIEADGAKWHTPEKDAIKDRELHDHGWKVYRVTGRDALWKENVLLFLRGQYPHVPGTRYWGEPDEDVEP